jgi:uncharacterized protein (TIGR03435 family)
MPTSRKPVPFVKTDFSEQYGPGRKKVYLAPFPGTGGKRQVPTAGGPAHTDAPTARSCITLKRRIEAIMKNRIVRIPNFAAKAALAVAGTAALAMPGVVGIVKTPSVLDQSGSPRAQASPLPGNVTARGMSALATPLRLEQKSPFMAQAQAPPARLPALQSPPAAAPEFDAASIKPGFVPTGRSGTDGGGLMQFEPERVFSRNATVRRMILEAYRLTPTQLTGGPAWLDSDWFALDARAQSPASTDQLRQMLQTLLVERCKLVARHETREMPVYVVTVAKNGPKLHEFKEDDPELTQPHSRERAIELWGARAADARAHWGGGVGSIQPFLQSLPNIISIGGFVAHPIDRPVVDKTGLSGHYWIQVGWDSDDDLIPAIQD